MTILINNLLQNMVSNVTSGNETVLLTEELNKDIFEDREIREITLEESKIAGGNAWPKQTGMKYVMNVNDYPKSTNPCTIFYGLYLGAPDIAIIFSWNSNKQYQVISGTSILSESFSLKDQFVIKDDSTVFWISSNSTNKAIWYGYKNNPLEESGLYFTKDKTAEGEKLTCLASFLVCSGKKIICFAEKLIRIYTVTDMAPYIEWERDITDKKYVPFLKQYHFKQLTDMTIVAPLISYDGTIYKNMATITYTFGLNSNGTAIDTKVYYEPTILYEGKSFDKTFDPSTSPNVAFLNNQAYHFNNWRLKTGWFTESKEIVFGMKDYLPVFELASIGDNEATSLPLKTWYRNVYALNKHNIYMFIGQLQEIGQTSTTEYKHLVRLQYLSNGRYNISIIANGDDLIVFKIPKMDVIAYSIDKGEHYTFIVSSTYYPLLAGDGTSIKIDENEPKYVHGDVQTIESGMVEIKNSDLPLKYHIYSCHSKEGGNVI